ncbi:hypothetical protein PanWU01x14_125020 [Parasponia andersonii]|uniref:Uncharacterized protein n=1 Tax=Parasponia andersonii TaxID=3476 RepID=A0A2P5CTQ5_PARAD|nr:hypothetical protein PanWU01x14_125020 [Parasponia andersonii]
MSDEGLHGIEDYQSSPPTLPLRGPGCPTKVIRRNGVVDKLPNLVLHGGSSKEHGDYLANRFFNKAVVSTMENTKAIFVFADVEDFTT